ncbi:hypothetical protein LPH68_19370 [Bacteroides sp. 1_1_30]|uniref:hypothetical protein n=1 Tax=unclassified Bacteroides TaxID=2646097 RepID=UPI001E2BADB6|nr:MULTISPECIES: hypothetical protein [unclassified Bacteroides]MCD0221889.1 hypothetical protein [Bacteroides sp. 1_1_30]
MYGFTANRLAGLPGGASADMCRHPRKLPFLSLSNCLPIPHRHPLPVLSSVSLFSIYSYLLQPIPVFTGWFFQSQRWTAALDSVTLKCISCKILPFCESVIFRKKRRKQLGRQSLKSFCKSQGGSDSI